jgi:hypothetical protein
MLGFRHSGVLDCEGAQGDYFACRQGVSNGDRTDIMGNGGYFPEDRPRHWSAIFKHLAGWLPAPNVISGELGVTSSTRSRGGSWAGTAHHLASTETVRASDFRDSDLTIEYRSAEGMTGDRTWSLVSCRARQLWRPDREPSWSGSFVDVTTEFASRFSPSTTTQPCRRRGY